MSNCSLFNCTFIHLLVLILVSSSSSLQNILHSITGVVSKNDFSYYTLQYTGYISIVLKSKVGDADLYISQPHISHYPTFDPDTYCLQSTTCGIDILHIPKWFKRPIYLGIYGYPSNEVANYTLDIIHNTDPGEEFNLNLFEEVEKKEEKEKEKEEEEEEEEEEEDEEEEEEKEKEEEDETQFIHTDINNDEINENAEQVIDSFSLSLQLFWNFIGIILEILFL